MEFDELGREIPDPRPLEIPAGFKKPESITDIIQRLVRTQLSQRAQEEGNETWEEANDFDMDDDDPDSLFTPYELQEMQEERPLADPGPAEQPESVVATQASPKQE